MHGETMKNVLTVDFFSALCWANKQTTSKCDHYQNVCYIPS